MSQADQSTAVSGQAVDRVREPFPESGQRRFGLFNWLGVWTLYQKEVQRFVKVYLQTIAAPVVTTLLFLAIFTLAFGDARQPVGGVTFSAFLAPGLIMMAIIQNSFANTSSSILISKVQGSQVDFLMPPLSPLELTFAFVVGGATRGMFVALVTGVGMLVFVDLSIDHLWAVVFFAFGASMILSSLGVLGGIWADKFDHMAAVTNFIITPLSFLSGTFYSVDRLPGVWKTVSQFNPFFYLIDGFRYGFIGRADGDLMTGVIVVATVMTTLWLLCLVCFRTGYKLKS